MNVTALRTRLLGKYELFPFHEHPLWRSIIRRELTLRQVLEAETQHYIRTKAGQALRKRSSDLAAGGNRRIFKAALQNYLEEVVPSDPEVSHLALIRRLLTVGGRTVARLDRAKPTPGNAAAMAMYSAIARRGPSCHLIGAGAVEHHYAALCPSIFKAYTHGYGMTAHQAETYSLHSHMDADHADRAMKVLASAVRLQGVRTIERSVEEAFIATSLHYDGMLQAATGRNDYWNGGTS